MSSSAVRRTPVWMIVVGIILGGFLAILAFFLIIQLIPYGRNHTNPPVVSEPQWDSPTTRELARRACFDCHSNETVWPWYTNIAPLSWLTQRDVNEGRSQLNFSEWGSQMNAEGEHTSPNEIAAIVQSGEMPPGLYLLIHPTARLSPDEIDALAGGLVKSLQP
jgi:mono/diheme cytochrome c family protein